MFELTFALSLSILYKANLHSSPDLPAAVDARELNSHSHSSIPPVAVTSLSSMLKYPREGEGEGRERGRRREGEGERGRERREIIDMAFLLIKPLVA